MGNVVHSLLIKRENSVETASAKNGPLHQNGRGGGCSPCSWAVGIVVQQEGVVVQRDFGGIVVNQKMNSAPRSKFGML